VPRCPLLQVWAANVRCRLLFLIDWAIEMKICEVEQIRATSRESFLPTA
jgi:hypothetical protein